MRKEANRLKSLKDITKELFNILSSNKDLTSLPDSLVTSIEAHLDQESSIDDASSQRLHDDLLAVYTKLVAGHDGKLGAFLQAVNLLRAYINGKDRKQEWWTIASDVVLNSAGRTKAEVENASAFALGVLDYDPEEDKSTERAKESVYFTRQLLQNYLDRTRPDPQARTDLAEGGEKQQEQHLAYSALVAGQIEHVLVAFGRKKPKLLLQEIDQILVDPEQRTQALSLLTAFVRHQPAHLYLVTQTPLFEHLLQCLMIDTSTVAIQLALTALIMFLPHIPSSIRSHLPRLFLIYSRLLSWGKYPSSLTSPTVTSNIEVEPAQDLSDDDEPTRSKSNQPSGTPKKSQGSWRKLEGDESIEDDSPLELSYFFTFLYGLYPLNFMAFVRKPRRYLKDINFPRAEQLDIDPSILKAGSESFRNLHLMHPNFFNAVMEEELEDDRWIKTDAADVVAECMGLRIDLPVDMKNGTYLTGASASPSSSIYTTPGPPPSKDLPQVPSAGLVSSGATRTKSSDAKSRPSSSSSTNKQSGRETPRAPPSPSLLPIEGNPQSTPKAAEANRAYLQRQVTLLRNDLNFERYLKQQHLAHIGQLQRRHVNDAQLAANAENLFNLNKSLRTRLTKANDSYTSLKRETATSRAQAKRFESELSSRVRGLREAERQWHTTEQNLRADQDKASKECDTLRQFVVDSEARELLSKQQIASMELELEKVDALRKQIGELQGKVASFEQREREFQTASDDVDTLKMDLATAHLQMQSREKVFAQAEKASEQRIASYETRLAEALSGERSPQVQILIEKAVSAANARLAALRKEHATLRHQYVELEMKCRDLEYEAGNQPKLLHSQTMPTSRSRVDSDFSSSESVPEQLDSDILSLGLGASSAPVKHTATGTPRNHARSSIGEDGGDSYTNDAANSMYQQQKSAFSAETFVSNSSSRLSARDAMRMFGVRGGTHSAGKSKSSVDSISSEKKKKARKPPKDLKEMKEPPDLNLRGLRGLV